MVYTKEFLISELQRFELENDRNPVQLDMQVKYDYPAAGAYSNHFGSWNKALIMAGLETNKINDRLTGYETCDNCGQAKSSNQHWYYKNNQRLCGICRRNINNYKNGGLEPNSKVGFGFIGQRVVAKTLDLSLNNDCNCSINFNAPYDLLDDGGYGYINVKSVILQKDNAWHFTLTQKQIPDTYIMLGFSNDKSNIEHVWITDSAEDLVFEKKSISITNSERGLKRAEYYEIDARPYNDAYHSMSLENCSVLRSN